MLCATWCRHLSGRPHQPLSHQPCTLFVTNAYILNLCPSGAGRGAIIVERNLAIQVHILSIISRVGSHRYSSIVPTLWIPPHSILYARYLTGEGITINRVMLTGARTFFFSCREPAHAEGSYFLLTGQNLKILSVCCLPFTQTNASEKNGKLSLLL